MKRQLVQLKSTLDEIKTLTEGKNKSDNWQVNMNYLKEIIAKHEDKK